jgi:hypothetical protein
MHLYKCCARASMRMHAGLWVIKEPCLGARSFLYNQINMTTLHALQEPATAFAALLLAICNNLSHGSEYRITNT